jgi:four helix bundle protein
MASYKQFEDLPVWQAATDLAAVIFELTGHEAFKYRGDLVNQIRRSALSISNNIAEGFERGSTPDLIHFLYIARGSCGETRSMLRFAPKLGGMEKERAAIDRAADFCSRVSRQLYGWIESLKNSDIKGQRIFDDDARRAYVREQELAKFREEFNDEAAQKALEEGRIGEYQLRKLQALAAVREAEENAVKKRGSHEK